MEQTKLSQDPEVTVTLNASEVFQLNLSVISRIGYCQQKWANASSATEQNNAEEQLAYLSGLSAKLQSILKDI